MADRSNQKLNEAIQKHIDQWLGTTHGYQVKMAFDKGVDYETLCQMCNLDYADYKEETA